MKLGRMLWVAGLVAGGAMIGKPALAGVASYDAAGDLNGTALTPSIFIRGAAVDSGYVNFGTQDFGLLGRIAAGSGPGYSYFQSRVIGVAGREILGSARGDWNDHFTISSGAVNGQGGLMTFRVHTYYEGGSLFNPGLRPYDWPDDGTWPDALLTPVIEIQSQSHYLHLLTGGVQSTALEAFTSGWVGGVRDGSSFIYQIPFTFGTEFTLASYTWGALYYRSMGWNTNHGWVPSKLDSMNLALAVWWGGIESVTMADGTPIPLGSFIAPASASRSALGVDEELTATLTTASGVDMRYEVEHPDFEALFAVPEPTAGLLVGLSLLGAAALQRRK